MLWALLKLCVALSSMFLHLTFYCTQHLFEETARLNATELPVSTARIEPLSLGLEGKHAVAIWASDAAELQSCWWLYQVKMKHEWILSQSCKCVERADNMAWTVQQQHQHTTVGELVDNVPESTQILTSSSACTPWSSNLILFVWDGQFIRLGSAPTKHSLGLGRVMNCTASSAICFVLSPQVSNWPSDTLTRGGSQIKTWETGSVG